MAPRARLGLRARVANQGAGVRAINKAAAIALANHQKAAGNALRGERNAAGPRSEHLGAEALFLVVVAGDAKFPTDSRRTN